MSREIRTEKEKKNTTRPRTEANHNQSGHPTPENIAHRTGSPLNLPDHPTARTLRQAAMLQMQNQVGNRQVHHKVTDMRPRLKPQTQKTSHIIQRYDPELGDTNENRQPQHYSLREDMVPPGLLPQGSSAEVDTAHLYLAIVNDPSWPDALRESQFRWPIIQEQLRHELSPVVVGGTALAQICSMGKTIPIYFQAEHPEFPYDYVGNIYLTASVTVDHVGEELTSLQESSQEAVNTEGSLTGTRGTGLELAPVVEDSGPGGLGIESSVSRGTTHSSGGVRTNTSTSEAVRFQMRVNWQAIITHTTRLPSEVIWSSGGIGMFYAAYAQARGIIDGTNVRATVATAESTSASVIIPMRYCELHWEHE